MVGEADPPAPVDWMERVGRLVADAERLHGPLRISVRQTPDGLGIHIPPQRSIAVTLFMMVWLGGWAAGEAFAWREIVGGGFRLPGLFMLIWAIPWTLAGLGVMWVILWQIFGRERLYFTAGALVREWNLLWQNRRRVVLGSEIVSVKVHNSGSDIAGLGTIKVETTGKSMSIGSGLDVKEAELVAALILDQAQSVRPQPEA